ncbi:MAG: hypothetical protein P8R54_27125 [Myxococcota bacterium]|nr:hypothetical protein [Myxococcota bacterium]
MLKKFVYITGFLDYLVGIATAAPVFLSDDPQQIPSLLSLGAFLCFAAASLMWASKDLAQRGCIVVWQALVRVTAVVATLVAIQAGIVEAMMALYGLEEAAIHGMLYGICAFDSVIASVYIIGTSRMEGHSFLGLLRGRSAAGV